MRALGGGATFFVALGAVQLTGGWIFRVSASRWPLASLYGGVGVVFASLLASLVTGDVRDKILRTGFHRRDELLTRDLVASSLAGLVTFRMLGGRFLALLPSDCANVGAFHSPRGVLEATLDYADVKNRGKVEGAGRAFGCHTCGRRSNSRNKLRYIADHQPPVKFVLRENARFVNRYLLKGIRAPVRQHFYPQCNECSLKQSKIVRKDMAGTRSALVYHFRSVRPYHLTGAFVGLWWWWYVDDGKAMVF